MVLAAALLALPIAGTAAHSFFAKPETLCFANGSTTYRVSATAAAPDYRIRIDNTAAEPDLRILLVDRPETADFVLADDYDPRERNACRTSGPIRTVRIDTETATPDVIVAVSAEIAAPDVSIYVRSSRFSHQDAVALQAAMWKADRRRSLAQRP
jgi:hypothetical protein